MRHLHLQPHVSYGMVAGRPLFLDVSRDRYFALDPAAEAAFNRLTQHRARHECDDPDAARLLATNLFALADERQPLAPAQIKIPDRDLPIPAERAAQNLLDLPEIWLLLWRARRALQSQRLNPILAALTRRRLEVTAPLDAAATGCLAARFRRTRALVPLAPSCLQDSLALGFWLARRSARPAIVFGAKLNPFGAHCWVQSKAAILSDAPDNVAEFTPVLVLR